MKITSDNISFNEYLIIIVNIINWVKMMYLLHTMNIKLGSIFSLLTKVILIIFYVCVHEVNVCVKDTP